MITIATSRVSRAARTASRSLKGTITVLEVASRGRPASSGTSSPSTSWTRVSSKCPWYFPSKKSTFSRPVATRATRIASVFACVADRVNCHFGRP